MSLYRLEPVIQHYSWGTYDVIPKLLGVENNEKTPYAELWMGTHPAAPSVIIDNGKPSPLSVQVQKDYKHDLPFLFKVLSARKPLSIQLHPDKGRAALGFEGEEAAGIAYSAPERIYKDKNHKPEMLIALEQTYALCSFRTVPEIIAETLPLFPTEAPTEADGGKSLSHYLASLLQLTGADKQQYIQGVLEYAQEKCKEDYDRYWWVQTIAKEFPGDVCCSAPLFCNLVCLQPSEALFVPPGEIHAYLRGSGIEIMATSDNVIRAGCTSKHVDVEALLKALNFSVAPPTLVYPQKCSAYESVYNAPAEEFECSCITLNGERVQAARNPLPEIILCVQGEVLLQAEDDLVLKRGDIVYVSPQTKTLGITGAGKLYRASLPGAAGLLR